MGRYSYEGIDMNHNFADLNTIMWNALELETDKSKLINHYFPIPEQYTSEEAFVSKLPLHTLGFLTNISLFIPQACPH